MRPFIAPTLFYSALLIAAATTSIASAAEKAPALAAERALDMDYGPFLSTSVMRKLPAAAKAPVKAPVKSPTTAPKGNAKAPEPEAVALKGIAIKVGEGPTQATVCFDTDRLCLAAGWTGGFVETAGTMLSNHKGNGYTTLDGIESFQSDGLGWGAGAKGDDFADPRPRGLGPLPAERGRYRGLYVHGRQVVLSYQVADGDVLELPGFEAAPGGGETAGVFTRTIRIERSASPLTMAVCDVAGGAAQPEPRGREANGANGANGANEVVVRAAGSVTAVGVSGAPKGAALRAEGGHVRLELPRMELPTIFKISIWKGAEGGLTGFAAHLKDGRPAADPKELCSGGPAKWAEPLTTAGRLGAPSAKKFPYVIDTLDLPDSNPWHSWLRLTGVDFFPDGRAAVCTFNGDVWIVSGIDEKLQKITWKRFAAGLYQPLGLKVAGDVVYVTGRDQITRLHDLNGDGEADFYEDFNSGGVVHPMYNTFAFDLQQGSDGAFYYSRGGHMLAPDYPGHGYVFRVSSDGSRLDPVATGLRAANGLGAGPDDRILVSDNEGEWTPASRINLLRFPRAGEQPDFLGFVPQSHREPPPTDYAKPLVWIPHRLDTSSGGEAYITDERWGPYKGDWVHTSYGTASLFLLLADESAGREPGKAQGAVIRFPLSFDTGIMRPRFNPSDGQLYVAGVGGGWQTSGTRDGGLYRVRYTGGPSYFPTAFRVQPHAVQFTFAAPLDRASASDEQGWAAEQWNYRWEAKYGSPDVSTKDPTKAGHDPLDVKSAAVSPDGKTVALDLPGLAPVMQLMIQPAMKAADGTPVEWEAYLTVNHVK